MVRSATISGSHVISETPFGMYHVIHKLHHRLKPCDSWQTYAKLAFAGSKMYLLTG
jgi:hypothetical protein